MIDQVTRFFAVLLVFTTTWVGATELQCHSAAPNNSVTASQSTASEQAQNFSSDNSLIILSDKTEVGVNTPARFSGQVSIIQGSNQIKADTARVSRDRNSMTAAGGIEFISQHATVHSDSLVADMQNSTLSLNKSNYQLDNFAGHGKAGVFRIDQQNKKLELEDATYTNCPPQNAPDWQLKSEKISLSVEDEWGEAWHSRIEVFEVPVIYLPYLSFPLSDKRKSGWLYPSIGTSSQRGVDLTTPYYWNIAPNMDLTLKPRLMTSRGMQLGSEFRYLQQGYAGELNIEFMSSDKDFGELTEQGDVKQGQDRHALSWRHQAQVFDDWQTDVDLIFLSDDSYVSDLGFEDLSGVDTHIERHIALSHYSKDWQMDVTIRDFEVFGQHSRPYRTLPEVDFLYTGLMNYSGWSFELPAQFAWFQSDEVGLAEAIRTHIEPKLSWSHFEPAWELQAQASLPATHYFQERYLEGQLQEGQFEQIGRVLPRFRLNGRLILERPIDWFGKEMKQTLEPRAQYLYVPHREQSKIGLYDTALLQDDFLGLFRENRFSGIDRISEANQFTLGVTTRLLNDEHREKLRLSVGQIIYLSEAESDFVDFQQTTIQGKSALAAELDFDIRKTWFLHYGLQFDTQNGDTRKSQVTVDYRRDDNHLMQLSHRFVRDISGNDIQQMGMASVWRLNPHWQTYANFHYDLQLNRTVEARVGLLYESCCWQLQFGWQSKVKTNLAGSDSQASIPTGERDSGMLLTFTIKGFGQSKNTADKVLNSGIFGYRKPYFLNQ